MKKLLCAFLLLPSLAWADITVTPGAGKTVATTTDNSKEYQNVVVTTSSVNNVSNVPVAVGWQVGGGSVPVHEAGTANVNITGGSIANTGFNVNNAPSITAITNALPAGSNNLGTVSGSTMSLQSGGVAITQTGGALDLNIKSGSIANTGFNVNNTPSVLVGTVTITTPVNNTTNLPVTVSNTGFNVNNTPTVLVGTVTISAPVNNTVPIPVTGSFSATSVNYSTYTYGNLIGTIGTAVGGIGPNGQFSTFAVDSSSSVNVHITAGAGSGGTSSNYKAAFPSAGTAVGGVDAGGNFEPFKVTAASEVFVTIVTTSTVVPPNGFNWPITGSISNTGFNVNNNVTLNALPTGTNNIGTVSGSTTVIQGSNGGGVTATAGALDINIKSGSIANTGFNVNNSPTVLPGNTANTTPWLMTSSITVTDISGANRTVGYASMNSSVPVNVLNTVNAAITNAPNIGTVTTLTGITNALPAGGNTIGNIGNLNGVVISSFAATSTPQVNLVMVASANVVTGNGTTGTGSQRVTIASDNTAFTVIAGSLGVVGIDGTSRGAGYLAQSSSVPVNSQGTTAVGASVYGNPVYAGVYVASSTFPTLATNGKGQYQLADPAGRTIVVDGVPSWMVKTATITLTGATPITIISSGGAGNFNDLCGCIGTNTSATNAYVTFQSTGALAGGWPASDFTLGMPANDVPVGFGPNKCGSAIPQRAANANWQVQASGSVTDLRLACYYYTIAR